MLLSLIAAGCLGTGVAGERRLNPDAEETGPTLLPESTRATQTKPVVVSGIFVRSFGDPPSDESDGARIIYTLSTSEKEDWVLVFDRERYWPENGVRGFHLQRVSVTGELLSDGTLLVKSIRTD